MKFHEWFHEWFLKYKKRTITEVTQVKYEIAHRMVIEYFGDVELVELTRDEVQDAIDKYGETRSKKTVRGFSMKIKACLEDAVIDKLIKETPYTRITLHHKELNYSFMELRKKSGEKKWLEVDEYDRLKKHLLVKIDAMFKISEDDYTQKIPTPYYYMTIYVALKTGCRYAEVLGLTKEDVDFEGNLINIDKTWDYKYKHDFMATKNIASVRKIIVDKETTKMIKKFIKWRSELKDDEPIFVSEEGTLHSQSTNKELRRILADCGIAYVSFHKLRHTQASYLLAKGVDMQVVAKRLGHTDTSMVQKVYGHLMEEVEEKENNKIISLL